MWQASRPFGSDRPTTSRRAGAWNAFWNVRATSGAPAALLPPASYAPYMVFAGAAARPVPHALCPVHALRRPFPRRTLYAAMVARSSVPPTPGAAAPPPCPPFPWMPRPGDSCLVQLSAPSPAPLPCHVRRAGMFGGSAQGVRLPYGAATWWLDGTSAQALYPATLQPAMAAAMGKPYVMPSTSITGHHLPCRGRGGAGGGGD